LPVDADSGEADGHLVVLHDHRHGRSDHVGGVGTEQEIDLVDSDEFGVDAGHIRWRGLIVVVDKFNRTTY